MPKKTRIKVVRARKIPNIVLKDQYIFELLNI